MNPGIIIAVALGGAAGSVARYLAMGFVGQTGGTGFPWGTLWVNIIGSCIMGLVIEGSALRWNLGPEWRAFLTMGVLGGFTTFSAFSLDAVFLLERHALMNAALYVAASVLFSVGALFGAMVLVRHFGS